jgi:DNA modification methylase
MENNSKNMRQHLHTQALNDNRIIQHASSYTQPNSALPYNKKGLNSTNLVGHSTNIAANQTFTNVQMDKNTTGKKMKSKAATHITESDQKATIPPRPHKYLK